MSSAMAMDDPEAIARVLARERAAAAAIADCQRTADALVAEAGRQARAIEARAERRAAWVHSLADRQVARRLATFEQAAANLGQPPQLDAGQERRLRAAVAALVTELLAEEGD